MRERLQKNAGTIAETSAPVRSTQYLIDSDYAGKVLAFINDAKSEIRICAYAWRWYENQPEIDIQRLNMGLVRAKRRGVKVRVLVDGYKVFQLAKKMGFDCRYVGNSRMLHTKAISIDNNTVIIGSHNLTKRATTDNYEISLAIQDYEVFEQFRTYFDKLWLRCYES